MVLRFFDDVSLVTNPVDSSETSQTRRHKSAVLYLSTLPPGISVDGIRNRFNEFSNGKVGRVSLAERENGLSVKRRKNRHKIYVEGWVEILSKSKAKQIAEHFNNRPMGGKKRNTWHDFLWNIKYLPRFKWAHLSEQMRYERAVKQDRLRTQIALARKEANFYTDNVELSEVLSKKCGALSEDHIQSDSVALSRKERTFRQNLSTEEILRKKGMTLGREDRLDAMKSIGLFGGCSDSQS